MCQKTVAIGKRWGFFVGFRRDRGLVAPGHELGSRVLSIHLAYTYEFVEWIHDYALVGYAMRHISHFPAWILRIS